MNDITLDPLTQDDRVQFILDNQEAFNYGALEEFGRRDDHFEEDDQIISRETIEAAINSGEAYRILQSGQPVGGAVIKTNGEKGELELLFVSPKSQSAQQRHRLCRVVRNRTAASRGEGLGNRHAVF